jgi:hypothetical protein
MLQVPATLSKAAVTARSRRNGRSPDQMAAADQMATARWRDTGYRRITRQRLADAAQ